MYQLRAHILYLRVYIDYIYFSLCFSYIFLAFIFFFFVFVSPIFFFVSYYYIFYAVWIWFFKSTSFKFPFSVLIYSIIFENVSCFHCGLVAIYKSIKLNSNATIDRASRKKRKKLFSDRKYFNISTVQCKFCKKILVHRLLLCNSLCI